MYFIKVMIGKHKLLFLFSIFLMIVYSFNGVLISSLVYYAGKFNQKTQVTAILTYLVLALIAWTIIYLAQFILAMVQSVIIKKTNVYLKETVIRNTWFKKDKHDNSADVISLLMNDFKLLENNYLIEAFSIIENILLLVVSLTYMLALNKLVAFVFIVFSLFPLVTPMLFAKKLSTVGKSWTEKNDKVIFKVKDFYQGYSTFRTYGVQKRIFKLLQNSIVEVEDGQYNLSVAQSTAQLVGSIVAGIGFITPFSIGCILIISTNSFNFTTLLAIFLANDRVISPIMNIVTSCNQIGSTSEIRLKILNIINKHPNISSNHLKSENSESIDFPILFEAHDIKYQITQKKSIEFDLVVTAQDKILIVGESGVGKSTLLKVLNGEVTFDCGSYVEIKADQSVLNNPSDEVAYINQTPYIYTGNIVNNITLFSSRPHIDELKTIFKESRLETDYSLDDLFQINLGENGAVLSGGQRQKIEVARALYAKKNLILADEVTANLDSENSKEIRNLLFNLPQPIIEVAHHYDLQDKRYTKIFNLQHDGHLIQVR